ncbi:hypothetical protein B5F76_08185 [Desulfovibrio sp. An276]|uniref:hypothetical protein n=1 Tax=Desulfovibrio sp. An276 TaxID=1965618 RepID=UPI000B3AA25D|nr:hypothetical protein [Desulfovibrio sp. An276]OUO51981.1 hypothetical protein B5F76_08185 [Desulfovibrio sp. An276]
MIVCVTSAPSESEFSLLMRRTDTYLNNDAVSKRAYYIGRSGLDLEKDVAHALDISARGTPFENTIRLVSGHKFPDIVASGMYGVEVKSTKEDKWRSTGSSILETTRIDGVERIYMTFGKLGGNPIQFRSKPYEKCLYDIAVTHMPRYLIDMDLSDNATIFDKLKIPYDQLRNMDNPIEPVAKYYRSQLKEGESLWWAGDSTTGNDVVPMKIRMWDTLSLNEKKYYIVTALLKYPEIFAGNYNNFAFWLVTTKGIVDIHTRDSFSAGGKFPMELESGEIKRFPAVYGRVSDNYFSICDRIKRAILNRQIQGNIRDIIKEWVTKVSIIASGKTSNGITRGESEYVLNKIFAQYFRTEYRGR